MKQSPMLSGVELVSGSNKEIIAAAQDKKASLVVIGPEAPLVAGLVDEFAQAAPSIAVFGPDRLAAQLEGSKSYMKSRCKRFGIPTADFDFAASYAVAERSIKENGFRVIKADGLAAGKGVVIAHSEEEALDAAKRMLVGGEFGSAGNTIVMEEKLEGEECSVMALCDGVESRLLPAARDYKRIKAGSDVMTGGMGAYAPLPDVSASVLKQIQTSIINKMLDGMSLRGSKYLRENEELERVGIPYKGVMFAGIMLTKEGPKLLEVNCRFGDPETQTILPLLNCDIVPYLFACTEFGGLRSLPPMLWKSAASVCVCIATMNYPAAGKRVDSIVETGNTVAEAREATYTKIKALNLVGLQYRDDIAAGV
jgi:phosphoribosylamine--glycine ligase